MTAETKYEIPEGYTESLTLDTYNILHLCPREETEDRGITNARFFEVILFDKDKAAYRIMQGQRDVLWSGGRDSHIIKVYIYKDGATLIEFGKKQKLPGFIGQTLYVAPAKPVF